MIPSGTTFEEHAASTTTGKISRSIFGTTKQKETRCINQRHSCKQENYNHNRVRTSPLPRTGELRQGRLEKNRSTLRACVVSAPDQTSRLNNEVESRTYRPLESTLRCAVSDIFLRRWATSRESTSLSRARTWKGRTVVSNWTMKVPRGSPSPMATCHLTRGGWTIFA